MTYLEWKPEFSVGVPAVDFEHQELIALINQLHESLQAGESPDRLQQFVGELNARISAHFALEEKLMREARYDQYAEHKQDHEALLDEIADIGDAVGDDSEARSDELAGQLDEWFSVHFRTHDARLHQKLG
ncbi:MAG: hemerythrin family protein [Chromatiales bacterium]|nr:MAG: hemerythrin family protein [Chromatiales bacterium]